MRQTQPARPALLPMTPGQQLRAGRMPRRLVQLFVGLVLYGVSLAFVLRASLGIEPWGVLAQGLSRHLPMTFGQVTIMVSLLVLILWIPLRQWPGLGTVCNAVVIGIVIDLALSWLPSTLPLMPRVGLLAGGIVLNGLASAIYIGAQLGPGARDGLMTGLVARTGKPVWMVRTGIEVTVVTIGYVLGGDLWIGTLAYAIGIGPLVQFFLPLVTVRLAPPWSSDASAPAHADHEAPDRVV